MKDDTRHQGNGLGWGAVGIAAFMAPQVALFLSAPQWPLTSAAPGWFLNAGGNVATIGCVIAVVAALLAVRGRWNIGDTIAFGLGVLIAVVGTLFTIGSGTIFPIVIVIGAVVVGVAILVGTSFGYAIHLASVRLRPSRR
jgi:hypothetical protein